MTKTTIIMALICILGMASCQAQTHQPAPPTTEGEAATVYMTTDMAAYFVSVTSSPYGQAVKLLKTHQKNLKTAN